METKAFILSALLACIAFVLAGQYLPPSGGGVATAIGIASGTATLGTSQITSTNCASVVTVAATGVDPQRDAIFWTPNADISSVTGFAPATSGGLQIYPYPSSNSVNFKVCNPTASSVTPGSAVTLNWVVLRKQ